MCKQGKAVCAHRVRCRAADVIRAPALAFVARVRERRALQLERERAERAREAAAALRISLGEGCGWAAAGRWARGWPGKSAAKSSRTRATCQQRKNARNELAKMRPIADFAGEARRGRWA